MNNQTKKIIWDKTGGHCHFCGKRLVFGARSGEVGRWHYDHIVPKARGGSGSVSNLLPICKPCNGLRWDRTSKRIKRIFRYGVYVYNEVRRKSEVGKKMRALYLKNRAKNKKRRTARGK